MGNVEKIFEALHFNKYTEIKAYVNPPGKEENLYLEFKEKENPRTPDLSDSDKKNYAIALSGFANSSGGVLVWGVTCAKIGGTDTASRLMPIDYLRQFMSNLNDITGDAVTPLVEGVIHEEIQIPNKENSGFLVTLIPESVVSPHRAEIKGTKQYYKRAGDGFYAMEHYDLEDMFGRRKKPRLSLEVQLSEADKTRLTTEERIRLMLTVSILNRGRAVAKYPFLSLSLPYPYYVWEYGIDGNRNHGLRLLPDSDNRNPKFGGSADQVIHQDTSLGITKIRAEIRIQDLGSISDFSAKYKLGAEDVKTVEDTYLIKGEKIKEFLRQQIPDLKST